MKKIWPELGTTVLTALLFYLLPLSMRTVGPMGLVFLLLLCVLFLSVVLGGLSRCWVKFLYPAAIALLFLPSVPIYYNESALVHALWYFVVAGFGLGIGVAVRALVSVIGRKISRKH